MYHTDSGEPAVGSSQPESISGSNGVSQGGKTTEVETAVNPQTSGTHTFEWNSLLVLFVVQKRCET